MIEMLIVKCNRCGIEQPKQDCSERGWIKIRLFPVPREGSHHSRLEPELNDPQEVDICPTCHGGLRRWWMGDQ